jgi:hypothetical protein
MNYFLQVFTLSLNEIATQNISENSLMINHKMLSDEEKK